MKSSKSNIINIGTLKQLVDPRYGKVLVVDSPDAVQLHKLDVAYAVINPGATSPAHYHETTEEVYAIVKGSATVVIDGVTTPAGPGDLVRIPVRTIHSITAGPEGCEFWVTTSPPYCIDDDIETDTITVEKRTIAPIIGKDALTIAVIVGTHRAGSVSAKIARQVAGMYRELGVTIDLIDPAELPNELYHPQSYETRYDPNTPLAKRLIAADGLHIFSAEYNGSFPAPLKHLLDIVPYKNCFDGKPVALVGVAAGDWGGLRAVDQLAAVFSYRSAHVYGKRVFIKNVDEVPADVNGHLTDIGLVERLCAQADGFAQFVRALTPTRRQL